MSRVTIADVARTAGVSKTAVSFAFNYPDRLGQATRDRVLQVAAEMGYSPHPLARALSLRRSGAIGLLIPQSLSAIFSNPFTSELIQGLGSAFAEHDLALLLVPPLAGSLEDAVRQASVDGFISLGLTADDPTLETLAAMRLPTVHVDADPLSGAVVNIDDRGGAEAAARHLIELGHRDLAVIMLPGARARTGVTAVAGRRLAGYRAVIEDAGLDEPLLVVAAATMEAGADAFGGLRASGRRPTAVLAMSDMAAIGMMAAAQEAGRRVPEDLSVVGFDDLPMAAWTRPGLTTVRQPIAEKGRLAAKLVISLLEGRRAASPAPLETKLVVRGSTASPGR
ncbi:MAG TPA: LacI family DNA-binding transcriptional regulator [Candidatus Dormibacteraeota bacterium]